jgi:chemosensory pili system protein ChpA (sensor histidine kinase/response regulator)
LKPRWTLPKRTVEPIAAEEAAADSGVASNVFTLPTATRPALPLDDSMRRVGTLDIPLALYNIYVAETDELLRLLERDFGEWRHEAGRPVTDDALTAVHTLAGTSATVGFAALRDLAYSLENTLGMLVAPAPTLQAVPARPARRRAGARAPDAAAFARGELAPAQPDVTEQLEALREALTAQQAAAAYGNAAPELAQQLDTLFAEAYDSLVAEPVESAAGGTGAGDDLFGTTCSNRNLRRNRSQNPNPKPSNARWRWPPFRRSPPSRCSTTNSIPTCCRCSWKKRPTCCRRSATACASGSRIRTTPAPAQGLLRTLHTVKGSARMAGAMRIGQHTHELETQVENMVHAGTTAPAAFDELMANYDTGAGAVRAAGAAGPGTRRAACGRTPPPPSRWRRWKRARRWCGCAPTSSTAW